MIKRVATVLLISSFAITSLSATEKEDRLNRMILDIYSLYNKQIATDKSNWEAVGLITNNKLLQQVDKKINNRYLEIRISSEETSVIDSSDLFVLDLENNQFTSTTAFSAVFKYSNEPKSKLVKLKYDVDYGKLMIFTDNGTSGILDINEDTETGSLFISLEDIKKTYRVLGGEI